MQDFENILLVGSHDFLSNIPERNIPKNNFNGSFLLKNKTETIHSA